MATVKLATLVIRVSRVFDLRALTATVIPTHRPSQNPYLHSSRARRRSKLTSTAMNMHHLSDNLNDPTHVILACF